MVSWMPRADWPPEEKFKSLIVTFGIFIILQSVIQTVWSADFRRIGPELNGYETSSILIGDIALPVPSLMAFLAAVLIVGPVAALVTMLAGELPVVVEFAKRLPDQATPERVQTTWDGIRARVVSIPCLETWAEASGEERGRLLPAGIPRLFVEAGTGLSWSPWMRPGDGFCGIRRFGASAPGGEVARRLGLSPEDVAGRAHRLLGPA